MENIGQTLSATPYFWVYKIHYWNNDEQIALFGCLFFAINVVSSAVWGLKASITYGKVVDKTPKGFLNQPVSAKTTWRYALIWGLIIPGILIATSPNLYLWRLPNVIGIGIYLIHYFHKSITYPAKLSKKSQPLALSQFIFYTYHTCLEAFFQIHYLLNIWEPLKGGDSLVPVVLGTGMAAIGFWINTYHDSLLQVQKSKEGGRQIPRGGLFEYISCANYFGEILEMCGFALVICSPMQALYALSTTMALIFRGRVVHNFYQERFGKKYPTGRSAVLPFLL